MGGGSKLVKIHNFLTVFEDGSDLDIHLKNGHATLIHTKWVIFESKPAMGTI